MTIELLEALSHTDTGILDSSVRPPVRAINAPFVEVRSATYAIQKPKGATMNVARDAELETSPAIHWLRDLDTNGSFPIAVGSYRILKD